MGRVRKWDDEKLMLTMLKRAEINRAEQSFLKGYKHEETVEEPMGLGVAPAKIMNT